MRQAASVCSVYCDIDVKNHMNRFDVPLTLKFIIQYICERDGYSIFEFRSNPTKPRSAFKGAAELPVITSSEISHGGRGFPFGLSSKGS